MVETALPAALTTCPRRQQPCWSKTRSSAGFRGGWNSDRGPWARARFSRRRSIQACRHNSTRSRTAKTFGQSRQSCWKKRQARGSRTRDISPFMLFVYDVLPEQADRIPAVRHVDGTARIQTINRDQHPLYHDFLQAFHRADRRAGARQHVIQYQRRTNCLQPAGCGRDASGRRRLMPW